VIEQVCAYIHNYFHGDRYAGRFTIEDGVLTVDGLVTGQYFQICGSRFNDGVHQYPPVDLTDETFEGVIWEMRVPRAFLDLVAEIEAWQEKYGAATAGPYQSESFNGYSYNKGSATDASGKSVPVTWQTTFGPYLNHWRKLA
jgi:hypothetical protein